MAYYEVIYETGAHGIIEGDDQEAVLAGLREQQRRAVNGEDGGPGGHPAERIKRVLKYDEHPHDYMPSQSLPVTDLVAELQAGLTQIGSKQGGEVSIAQAIQELIHIGGPLTHDRDTANRHDSIFKMEEAEELDASLWEA